MNPKDPSLASFTPSYHHLRAQILKKTGQNPEEGTRYVFVCYQRADKSIRAALKQDPTPRVPRVPASADFEAALSGTSSGSKPVRKPDQLGLNAQYVHGRTMEDIKGISSKDDENRPPEEGGFGMAVYELGANRIGWKHAIVCAVELDPPWLDTFVGSQWDLINEGDKSDVRWKRNMFIFEEDADKYKFKGVTDLTDTDIDQIVAKWVKKHPKYNLLLSNCLNLANDVAREICSALSSAKKKDKKREGKKGR